VYKLFIPNEQPPFYKAITMKFFRPVPDYSVFSAYHRGDIYIATAVAMAVSVMQIAV